MQFRADNGRIIPALTTDQMREVDRLAVSVFQLGILQMMENAGRSLAENVIDMIGTLPDEAVILAGGGGNGGGALCCARHLHNRGVKVHLVLDRAENVLQGAAAAQFAILRGAGLRPIADAHLQNALQSSQIVVDGLIGYGLKAAPSGQTADLIALCNQSATPVLANDIPSGVDSTTGKAVGSWIRSDRILTLAAPKIGLANFTQSLYLADIGIPPELYREIGLHFESPFGTRYWVRLTETIV